MKKRVKLFIKRGETGGILILVLICLMLGVVLIPVTLGFMQSGIKAGRAIETRSIELYAADAGVEAGMAYLKANINNLPVSEISIFTLGTEPQVNGHPVEVRILQWDATGIYRIQSNALLDGVTKTGIEAFVKKETDAIDFNKYAIVSDGNVIIKPGVVVGGDILYDGMINNKGVVEGVIIDAPIPNWPSNDEMASLYLEDVEGLAPYPVASINVKYTHELGPIYRVGDFDIYCTQDGNILTLDGTVFIDDGDLYVAQNGNKNPVINLNGKTIYVDGDVYIAAKAEIIGTGAIIARGNINYQPQSTGEANPVVILSVR